MPAFAACSFPVQASIGNDDVAITIGVEPVAERYYDSSDLIDWTPAIRVENQYDFNADARNVELEICGGDFTDVDYCPTAHILKEASTQSPNLNRSGTEGDSAIVHFYSFLWFIDSGDISTYSGVFTVMFHFTVEDNDGSNDHLRYTVYIVDDLVDLIANGHDVDTSTVYNSNVPIPANLDVNSRSWPADQNFSTAWSMHMVNPLVADSEDCVGWEMNFTGQGNIDGSGELIIHTATHSDTISNSYYAPYDIQVGITNTSSRIFGNIAASGTEYGVEHNVLVSGTLNGSELFSETWNFIGDGTVQNQQFNTEFANGTICFTVEMVVPDIMVAEDSHEIEGNSGTYNSRDIPLPDIIAPFPGDFEVRARTNGTFLGVNFDLNDFNDMVVFDLTVNDTTDLWIREVVPARGTTTYVQQGGEYLVRFPYGEQSIRAVSGNIGWVTADARVEVNLYDLMTDQLAAGPYSCNVTLMPGEEIQCDFDFSATGLYKLNASITTTDGHIDSFPSDNWFEQAIIIDFGAINPTIANPTASDVFETGQNILAVAGVDPQAPMPLNYTWRMNYMEILGYGAVTNITLPMGEWVLTLYVTDEVGNLEIATQPIRILNRVEFSSAPYVTAGVSISTYTMELVFDEPQLPPPGVFYGAAHNRGKEPLVLFNLSMVSPYGIDIEVDSIEAWLDLEQFLPPAIDQSTVELLRLPDWSETWAPELSDGDSFAIYTNGSLQLITSGDIGGTFMIIGQLDPVDVNPDNLTIVLQQDGQVMLDWDNGGDHENPYFGGWRIYRKETFRFSYPFSSESQFTSATDGYLVLDVAAENDSWQDPNYWDQGTCLSYLVMSLTRAGTVDWHFGNVSDATWNGERMVADEVCVDNSNPETTVDDMDAEVTFDNTTKLHTIHLSWTWPEIDEQGPLTWNLYRAQIVVNSVTYLEPLEVGLVGEVDGEYWYNETESGLRESIKVEQFYYYVLIPFDEVGNSDYLVREDNAAEVNVNDQFWDYHLPPPPPEPEPDPSLPGVGPSPWYGRLLDDLNSDRFTQAGTICLAVMVMNLLMIPMLVNKFKEQKVKIKRYRRRKQNRDDDFDDFFD